MSQLDRRRTHNLLLIAKLLSQRDNSSLFTLILDSLEQSAAPLVQEYITRAKVAKVKILYASYDSIRGPPGVDIFIKLAEYAQDDLTKILKSHVQQEGRTLIISDNLNAIASLKDLPAFLFSLVGPTTYVMGVWHSDLVSTPFQASPYSPSPLVLLKHLATTILTTRSLPHVLERKRAQQRSVAEPSFGISENIEGAITSIGGNDPQGLVFNMEYRRKSGRGVREWFILHDTSRKSLKARYQKLSPSKVTLLEDHPVFAKVQDAEAHNQDDDFDSTFNLGLSERQRKDREGVVLPYFDAQKEEGVGQGGRILYDMGIEDDFDEEEDEI
ncbi:MAG: hypothetical protein M1820_002258 [Bogoriella megaspora]|nr:MAG: hypothetical protein M1820_002258 [Bogoriella megaspora]